MKNWIYNQFMTHKQYSKVFGFKLLWLLTLTKFWFYLINSLTAQKSISCSMLLSFTLTFNILFSKYLFFTSLQQSLLQSCSDLFLNFSFHYSLNKRPSFSGFTRITIKLRNVAFHHKCLKLVLKANFSH